MIKNMKKPKNNSASAVPRPLLEYKRGDRSAEDRNEEDRNEEDRNEEDRSGEDRNEEDRSEEDGSEEEITDCTSLLLSVCIQTSH